MINHDKQITKAYLLWAKEKSRLGDRITLMILIVTLLIVLLISGEIFNNVLIYCISMPICIYAYYLESERRKALYTIKKLIDNPDLATEYKNKYSKINHLIG